MGPGFSPKIAWLSMLLRSDAEKSLLIHDRARGWPGQKQRWLPTIVSGQLAQISDHHYRDFSAFGSEMTYRDFDYNAIV
jgi:hypothetical protein